MKTAHWHTDAIHIGVTTIGVFVAAWTFRIIAAKAAGSGNATLSNLGKAVGGFFSLPSAGG